MFKLIPKILKIIIDVVFLAKIKTNDDILKETASIISEKKIQDVKQKLDLESSINKNKEILKNLIREKKFKK